MSHRLDRLDCVCYTQNYDSVPFGIWFDPLVRSLRVRLEENAVDMQEQKHYHILILDLFLMVKYHLLKGT